MLSLKGVKVILLVLSILMIAVSYSYAVNVPQMINYSGTLNDINGNPVANGNYSMEFRIYDQASGGAALWTEKWDTTTSQVPVVNGTFNVMLGAIDKALNPIPASFFADHPTTYLGIKVGNDSEMLPRQMITSVGYALSAWNGVPKGGIIMWSGTANNGYPIVNGSPDTGWHICDGTNGTPDLRDRFIVSVGNSYAVGATGGEATHVLTISEMPSHTHTQNAHTHIQDAHTHGIQLRGDGDNGAGSYNAESNDSSISSFYTSNSATATNQNTTAINQNTGSGAAHENRPPYYALAFIMKL